MVRGPDPLPLRVTGGPESKGGSHWPFWCRRPARPEIVKKIT